MIELALAVGTVVAISAFCSLCEAALYATPLSHIERLSSQGSRSGAILARLRERVDEPITAILALNTVANTAGASIAGALAARALGADWLIAFSAGFTLLILFASEILPKTIGVVFSRSVSVAIARPLQGMVIMFKPITWLSGLFTRAITGKSLAETVSSEELVVMTRLGLKAGSITTEEAEVIQNILAVRDRRVADVMTPKTVLFSLDASTTVQEVSQEKRIYFHSRVPVYVQDDEEIVGIAYRRDVLSKLSEGRGDERIRQLVKPVHFVLESTTLDKVLKRFLDRHQHMFVVLDEFGGLAGVITLEDVLEEILGAEIVDEFDEVVDMRAFARERRETLLRQRLQRVEKPS